MRREIKQTPRCQRQWNQSLLLAVCIHLCGTSDLVLQHPEPPTQTCRGWVGWGLSNWPLKFQFVSFEGGQPGRAPNYLGGRILTRLLQPYHRLTDRLLRKLSLKGALGSAPPLCFLDLTGRCRGAALSCRIGPGCCALCTSSKCSSSFGERPSINEVGNCDDVWG